MKPQKIFRIGVICPDKKLQKKPYYMTSFSRYLGEISARRDDIALPVNISRLGKSYTKNRLKIMRSSDYFFGKYVRIFCAKFFCNRVFMTLCKDIFGAHFS
jgi:hypothetical protein